MTLPGRSGGACEDPGGKRCAVGADGAAPDGRGVARVYPQVGAAHGGSLPSGDPTGASPADLGAGSHAVRRSGTWARARAVSLIDAAGEIFYRTLPEELKTKLAQKKILASITARWIVPVAKGGDIKFIDFRERLVSPFQTVVHHARWASRGKPAGWRICPIASDYGAAGEKAG